jgi:DNA-binding NarL/FixJ family response regulator
MKNLNIALSSQISKTHNFVANILIRNEEFKLYHYTDEEDLIEKMFHETNVIVMELDFNQMQTSEAEFKKLTLLKERFPAIPVIILSSGPNSIYAKELRSRGAVVVINMNDSQAAVELRKVLKDIESGEEDNIKLSFIDKWEKKQFWGIYTFICLMMAANFLLFLF